MKYVNIITICMFFTSLTVKAEEDRDIYRSLCSFFVNEGVLSDSSKCLRDSTIILDELLQGDSGLSKVFGIFNIKLKNVYDGPGYLLIKDGDELRIYVNWKIESVTSDLLEINTKKPEILDDKKCLEYLKILYHNIDLPIRIVFKKGDFLRLTK